MCWQWLGLGPAVRDVEQAARRIGVIADAYGDLQRSELVATALWWQDRCWRGIEAAATGGDPGMLRLVREGVPRQIRIALRGDASGCG